MMVEAVHEIVMGARGRGDDGGGSGIGGCDGGGDDDGGGGGVTLW